MLRVVGAEVQWFEQFDNSTHLIVHLDGDSPIVPRHKPIWRYIEVNESTGGDDLSADQMLVVGGKTKTNKLSRWVVAEVPIGTPDDLTAPAHNAVSFVALDERPAPAGGALGGTFVLQDGSEIVSPGGWSSRAGRVNDLRKELGLSDYVLDIAWKTPRFTHTMLAGHCTLSVAQRAIRTFLPGVYLVTELKWDETTFVPSLSPERVVKPKKEVN